MSFDDGSAGREAQAGDDATDEVTVTNLTGQDVVGQDAMDGDAAPVADAVEGSGSPVDISEESYRSLLSELELEQEKSRMYEQKLKLALADFQNLSKKTQSAIGDGITAKLGEIMLDLLVIYDDFTRARDAFEKEGADTSGLDSILKNMNAMLQKHAVTPIEALGEIFDPNMHEAISTDVDPSLDENTITRELRRGYMIKNTIIRPTLVVISKKE